MSAKPKRGSGSGSLGHAQNGAGLPSVRVKKKKQKKTSRGK